MRRTLMTGVGTVVALTGATLLAQDTYNENAADKVEAREGTVGQKGSPPSAGLDAPANVRANERPATGATVNAPGANVNVGTRPAGTPANQWRYRQHNGHWWYYHPNNQWSYWNGNAWNNYEPQAYRQWYNGQSRPYANNYGNGNYGYNRYNTGYRGGYYGGRTYRNNSYGNNYYGNGYGPGYATPGAAAGANAGAAVGGAIDGAAGENLGGAIGGAVGNRYGRR
jgi:hypothetical protein